ncbi:unnamed protein product [Strongylus vulgaris]|uniref:PH domain-containing protein n=1 Tax=Strongylus vulgaris TaxID=40348 RepID=A0A3P7J2D0_STRVU|nr:unnamed protein product [Strongylus vulgaris]
MQEWKRAIEMQIEDCGYDFYITAQNYRAMQEWKRAIEMQIEDCAIWGEFAYRNTKLTFEKPIDPVKETLSRAAGKCLYDKIGRVYFYAVTN